MLKVFRNIIGVALGFISVIATLVMLSILSIAFFADMVTEEVGVEILMTATKPLLYSLASIAMALVAGIYVASLISKTASISNALIIMLLYGAYAFGLSRIPSSAAGLYPDWYVIASYLILLPSALLGQLIAKKLK